MTEAYTAAMRIYIEIRRRLTTVGAICGVLRANDEASRIRTLTSATPLMLLRLLQLLLLCLPAVLFAKLPEATVAYVLIVNDSLPKIILKMTQ